MKQLTLLLPCLILILACWWPWHQRLSNYTDSNTAIAAHPDDEPFNKFPGCRFLRLKEREDTYQSEGECLFIVKGYRTICNKGGWGSESGEPNFTACQITTGIDGTHEQSSEKDIVEKAKIGVEYVVRANITILDQRGWEDVPRDFNINFENVTIVEQRLLSPDTCYIFSSWPIDNQNGLAKVIKTLSELLQIRVNCSEESACLAALNEERFKGCFEDQFKTLVLY